MNSIHSACAAAFARHRGKTGTLHLLQEEIFRLEKAIESVSKYVGIYRIPQNAKYENTFHNSTTPYHTIYCTL